MKKFGLKFFSIMVALLVAVVLTGCSIKQGTKIEFTQLPAGVYTTETGAINLETVKIKINDGSALSLKEAQSQYDITITGSSWSTYGDYTLVVILDNAAVSFNYSVVKEIVQIDYDVEWAGEGTEESPWLISSEKELKGLAAVVNKKATVDGLDASCAGKYFQLTADIELTPGWEPIGASYRKANLSGNYFGGNFDGDNHVITGLTNVGYNPAEVAATYKTSGGAPVANGYVFGLFGVLYGATIKNVVMESVYTQDISLVVENEVIKFELDSVGAIAGYIAKPIKGANVTSDNIVEGLLDEVTTIENCHVLSGEISGFDATAGIVGRTYGNSKFLNCSNAANISCDRGDSGAKSGGITAITSSETLKNTDYNIGKHEVKNCSNSGKVVVSSSSLVGGIVGFVNTGIKFVESGNKNTGRLFALNAEKVLTEYSCLGTIQNQKTCEYALENPVNWK